MVISVTTCDLCHKEIRISERIIHFAAKRFTDDVQIMAEFRNSDFCSDGCVIKAVRGLLNG